MLQCDTKRGFFHGEIDFGEVYKGIGTRWKLDTHFSIETSQIRITTTKWLEQTKLSP